MSDIKYPTFDLNQLIHNKISNDILTTDRFGDYLQRNPHLQGLHNHHYYHFVLFTKGSGFQIIDFEQFEVKPGILYFMRPGQVHNWQFKSEVDGYVINFSPSFFEWLNINSNILDQFNFINSDFISKQVIFLDENHQNFWINKLEEILLIRENNKKFSNLQIALKLLDLFVETARLDVNKVDSLDLDHHYTLLVNFKKLIEENYKSKRFPKDYADLLFVTTNHLNFVCQQLIKRSSGDLIRERILLEAKRLLVNFEWSINQIAVELNFSDSSNFIKFFKKYAKKTPDQFRLEYKF